MKEEFDAFILGGGPAGCSAAISLVRAGYTVCLAENAGSDEFSDEFKVGESLPPAVKPLLNELGALSLCHAGWSLISYGNQSAWGSPILGETDFIHDPNGYGWHVDRARFDAELRAVAAGAGAFVSERTRALRIEPASDRWLVTLKTPAGLRNYRSRWMLDCTGRTASFARAQGARPIVYDRLIAVVAVFAEADARPAAGGDRDSRTLVESSPDGWWYTSLVPRHRRIVAFHTDAATDVSRLARTPEGFISMLRSTRHISARIEDPGYRLAGPLRIAAANTVCRTPAAGRGWFAAGDAAIAFDPLSSQGILTALYSGLKAAQALQDSMNGIPDAPLQYEQTLRNVLDAYLVNRDLFYGYESRWPDRPFWSRRRAGAVESAGAVEALEP
jgi:flavin-dependent dehydrogenase